MMLSRTGRDRDPPLGRGHTAHTQSGSNIHEAVLGGTTLGCRNSCQACTHTHEEEEEEEEMRSPGRAHPRHIPMVPAGPHGTQTQPPPLPAFGDTQVPEVLCWA